MNEELHKITVLPDYIYGLLTDAGMSHAWASWIDQCISLVLLGLVAWLIGYIADKIADKVISRIVRITKNRWDDVFFENKVFHKVIRLISPILIYWAIPIAIRSEGMSVFLKKIVAVYIIARIMAAITGLTKSLSIIYSKRHGPSKPTSVFFQIINVIAYFLGSILIISIIINQSLGTLIAGLGASMAIITIIFKDSILGFISGWQLSANDLLRIGDWITMPKYGVDGNVIDMNLYSVKVRNFDNTIMTVPPYALVSESFQNWRGMSEMGGRRIKRSINIDMKSVKFCDEKMLLRFSEIGILKDYIERTQQKLREMNNSGSGNAHGGGIRDGRGSMAFAESQQGGAGGHGGHCVDIGCRPDVLRQTNLGVFRAYVTAYIESLPEIRNDFTYMVRQLQPAEKGIPLEIYCFTKTTEWVEYERIQSDIFDHVISVIPFFELEVFQYPTDHVPVGDLD